MKNTTLLLIMIFGILLMHQESSAQSQQAITEQAATKLVLNVQGMSCQAGCADGINKILKKQEGVVKSETTYTTGTSEIWYNKELIAEKKIIDLITKQGFKAMVKKDDHRKTNE